MTIAYEPPVNSISAGALAESPERSASAADVLALKKTDLIKDTMVPVTPGVLRQTDDEINRFLLCVLVSKSAKHIKEKAGRAGENLPTAAIVRSVLRSYCLAAKESPGFLAGSDPHLGRLSRLNGKVLKDEIKSSVQGRVKDSQTRLERANRLGDDARIKIEMEALARDTADRDRVLSAFK